MNNSVFRVSIDVEKVSNTEGNSFEHCSKPTRLVQWCGQGGYAELKDCWKIFNFGK